jgi:AbrB family looped-hinge helix DNA binding protein
MTTLRMGRKGQLTVPRAMRERLELRPGCQVDARVDDEGRLVLTPILYEPEDLLARRPPRAGRVASIEEMEAGIRRGAARRHRPAVRSTLVVTSGSRRPRP